MPRPALRSRSLRRIKVKTPSGKHKIHYERKKPTISKCAKCKKPLHGMPRLRQSQVSKLPKTKRVPTRPYGGNLCPICTKDKIKEKLYQHSPGKTK